MTRLVTCHIPLPARWFSALGALLSVGRSSAGIVPVSLPGTHRRLIAGETVLEEVEDGKLVARHDVRVRRGLDLAPDARQRRFEDLANGWVRGTVRALTGDLECLGDAGVLRRGARAVDSRTGRRLDGGATHGHEVEEVLVVVRHLLDLLDLLAMMVRGSGAEGDVVWLGLEVLGMDGQHCWVWMFIISRRGRPVRTGRLAHVSKTTRATRMRVVVVLGLYVAEWVGADENEFMLL